jgi:hypothetical protein
MKNATTIFCMAACLARAALAATMASQPWTTNRIAEAEARLSAKVSAATNGLASKDDLGGYLSLYGGTLTGDLAVGEEHTASRKLTVAAENGAAGITLKGGTSTGIGSSMIVGSSSGGGGEISIQGGGSSGGRLYVGGLTGAGGGAIEVDGMGASIKKAGSEVATEAYVDEKVSGVSGTLTTLAGAVNSKADKTNVYTKEEVDEKVDAVDNKADEAYSAADQMVDAVNSLSGTIGTHIRDTNNPHNVTAEQVGATTPADVTAAIREQSLGGIWDETLQVWWTPRMRNGSLTYEATTNVNLNAEN